MEIIGAGFGRTGTNSLKVALEILGYAPCYHMYEVTENPDHVDFWTHAATGHSVDYRLFFTAYKAAVDWPTSAFVEQIHSTFKSAKVILTTRDPEQWYESAKNTIFMGMANWNKIENPETRARMKMANQIIIEGIFSGNYENKSHCIDVYNNHIDKIKTIIPKKDLLEFNVADGWKPLCTFLEKEVPEKPFPHTNTRASFHKFKPK